MVSPVCGFVWCWPVPPLISPVAGALVELPAAGLPEVGYRAELAHDGPPRVPPPHEPLERRVRVLLIQELSHHTYNTRSSGEQQEKKRRRRR